MGIPDALMGHGSEVAAKEVAGRLEGVLLTDETAKLAFRLSETSLLLRRSD